MSNVIELLGSRLVIWQFCKFFVFKRMCFLTFLMIFNPSQAKYCQIFWIFIEIPGSRLVIWQFGWFFPPKYVFLQFLMKTIQNCIKYCQILEILSSIAEYCRISMKFRVRVKSGVQKILFFIPKQVFLRF